VKRNLIFIFLLAMLLVVVEASSCSRASASEIPSTQTPTADQEAAGLPTITVTPTTVTTPGLVTDVVEAFAIAVGVEDILILGLTPQDWVNLGISVLVILFGFLIASPLIVRLLRKLVRRTPVKRGETLVEELEPQIRWLVIVLIFQFATTRLVFLTTDIKLFFGHIYFIIYLVIILSGLWKLMDDAIEKYLVELSPKDDLKRLEHLLPLLQRLAHIILVIFGAQVLLGRFGIQLGAIATALGIGGLAISLAAQDILGDFIAGFIILISQPFRVGDRIEIQDLGTWGDVVSIGARATNIRTRDNRMVIVPNSTIGKSQVVNYTYPDSRYRVQIEIGIAYGTDIEKARRIIIDTVRKVEGVLNEKPVDALYIAMGDSAMTFRVRWWIESYVDTRLMFDRVNTALQIALDEAGIDMPFPTQELNVRINSEQG